MQPPNTQSPPPPDTNEVMAIARAHCAYCKAGLDRTAETGGLTFIHILTRGADGQILKWRPCNRSGEHF